MPPRPTDGLAVASMVVSIVSVPALCVYGLGAAAGVTGAVLGHVARRRIARSGAPGDGMALAGIIVGWISTVLGVLSAALVVAAVILVAQTPNPG